MLLANERDRCYINLHVNIGLSYKQVSVASQLPAVMVKNKLLWYSIRLEINLCYHHHHVFGPPNSYGLAAAVFQ